MQTTHAPDLKRVVWIILFNFAVSLVITKFGLSFVFFPTNFHKNWQCHSCTSPWQPARLSRARLLSLAERGGRGNGGSVVSLRGGFLRRLYF